MSLLTYLFLSQPWVIYVRPISILQVQNSLFCWWHCDKVTGWELQSSQIVMGYSMCKQSQGLGICSLCSQTKNMQNTKHFASSPASLLCYGTGTNSVLNLLCFLLVGLFQFSLKIHTDAKKSSLLFNLHNHRCVPGNNFVLTLVQCSCSTNQIRAISVEIRADKKRKKNA